MRGGTDGRRPEIDVVRPKVGHLSCSSLSPVQTLHNRVERDGVMLRTKVCRGQVDREETLRSREGKGRVR